MKIQSKNKQKHSLGFSCDVLSDKLVFNPDATVSISWISTQAIESLKHSIGNQANCQAGEESALPLRRNSLPSSQTNYNSTCSRSVKCSHFPAISSSVGVQAGGLAYTQSEGFVWILCSPLTWCFTMKSKHISLEHWKMGAGGLFQELDWLKHMSSSFTA